MALGILDANKPLMKLADDGSIDINQPLSASTTTRNDVITGTNAVNNLVGFAGNDLIKGLGGNDTIDGGDGSDFLDGGPGND